MQLGADTYEQDVRFSGQAATFMGVWVLPNANALDVIARVNKEMEQIKADLPTGLDGVTIVEPDVFHDGRGFFLALGLAMPKVEAMLANLQDLTVRDNRVYLKVLGGLQPVDVILRRLDDDFCDPLELRPDSFLGVPGLVQAVHPRLVQCLCQSQKLSAAIGLAIR